LGLVVFLLVPVQTTVGESLRIGGIKPDLGLLWVIFIGLRYGEVAGMGTGAVVGLLFDLFSGGAVGSNLATKALIGWLSGIGGRLFLRIGGPLFGAMLLAGSLLSGLLGFLMLRAYGFPLDAGEAVRWIILPQTVYDVAFGTAVFYLAQSLYRNRPLWVRQES
jgi:rod shape-determining protein MreD